MEGSEGRGVGRRWRGVKEEGWGEDGGEGRKRGGEVPSQLYCTEVVNNY